MGLVTCADPGKRSLWVDEALIGPGERMPRTRSWRERVLYAAPTVANTDLTSRMEPGDTAWGPRPGQVSVAKYACQGGSYYVIRSDAWGVEEPEPSAMVRAIERLHRLCRDADIVPMRTASATVRKLFLERFGGERWCRSLAPRWRGLAHAAIHGGPAVCIAAGGGKAGPEVVCMDVSRAYLRGLCEPMPMLGFYPARGGRREGRWLPSAGPWSAIRDRTGIMEATVRCSGPKGTGRVPPLPVLDPDPPRAFVYPTGEFRGCWTLAHVRDAEERGEVEVLTVHQAMVASATVPIFRPVAEFLQELGPELGKPLYARMYGILASAGGMEARRERAGEPVHWVDQSVKPMEPGAPPTYRPDCAAFVTGSCHRTVFRALRSLDESRTVAIHVDCIWTHDLEGAARLPEPLWREKRRGRVWYMGAGTFAHWRADGTLECGAAGYDRPDRGPVTLRSLLAHAGAEPTSRGGRYWVVDGFLRLPSMDAGATSEPPELFDPPTRSTVPHPNVNHARWNADGTWREK